jgi:hypothetical protein
MRRSRSDGEGRNRTGDTTIFSRGSRSDRRARAELFGENVPVNRCYRRLRSVSRYAGVVRARGRQVDVAQNAPRQHRSAETNEARGQRWWVTSGDSITRTKWSSTFGKPASRSSPPRRWRVQPPRSRKPLRALQRCFLVRPPGALAPGSARRGHSLAHRPQSPVNRGRIVESQGFRDRG